MPDFASSRVNFQYGFCVWFMINTEKIQKAASQKIVMYKLCYETFQHAPNFNIPYIAMYFIIMLL